MQIGKCARDRGDAGRDRDRDGQEVVDKERARRDEPGDDAEVLFRDHVAAAALRVRADDLEIREHDDREHDADRDRERHRERERAGTGEREDAHRFLGRVGRGRDVVRGEDREPDLPTDALLFLLGSRETPTDEDAVDRRPRAPDPAPAFERTLRRDKARRGMSELGRSDDADVTVARPSTLELFTPVEAAQSRRV